MKISNKTLEEFVTDVDSCSSDESKGEMGLGSAEIFLACDYDAFVNHFLNNGYRMSARTDGSILEVKGKKEHNDTLDENCRFCYLINTNNPNHFFVANNIYYLGSPRNQRDLEHGEIRKKRIRKDYGNYNTCVLFLDVYHNENKITLHDILEYAKKYDIPFCVTGRASDIDYRVYSEN